MGFSVREMFAAYERLGDAVWRGLMYGNRLEIVEEGADRLELKTGMGRFAFDAVRKTIRRKDRLIARFEEIRKVILRTRTVDIDLFIWSVSLEKTDGRIVDLGKSTDDVEASIAAAHVARLIGVDVDSVR